MTSKDEYQSLFDASTVLMPKKIITQPPPSEASIHQPAAEKDKVMSDWPKRAHVPNQWLEKDRETSTAVMVLTVVAHHDKSSSDSEPSSNDENPRSSELEGEMLAAAEKRKAAKLKGRGKGKPKGKAASLLPKAPSFKSKKEPKSKKKSESIPARKNTIPQQQGKRGTLLDAVAKAAQATTSSRTSPPEQLITGILAPSVPAATSTVGAFTSAASTTVTRAATASTV